MLIPPHHPVVPCIICAMMPMKVKNAVYSHYYHGRRVRGGGGGAEGLRPPPPPPRRTYSFYKVINMRYDLIVLDPPSNLQIVHVHNNDEAK